MILLGALAALGVIVALFMSAKKRSVEVVNLQPEEPAGPAIPQRLSADKQAVRAMSAPRAETAAPPPLPPASKRGIIAPDNPTRRALAANNRDEAVRLYAGQTGLNLDQARNTLDAIMSGSIPIESLVFNAAPPVNVDEAIQAAMRAGNKIEAIKLYKEKTGLGLHEAKENIEAMMRGDTPAWGTGATLVDHDSLIQNALRAGNKIEAIKHYREKTGLGLKEAKDAIDAMISGNAPPPLPVRANVDLDAAIQNALRAGNKIEAVKFYREKTGLGLKEAKDAIDAMFDGVQRVAPPSPSATTDSAIDDALRNDQLIQAIKLFRQKTGLGLAEAKTAMEARRRHLRR